MGLARAVPDFYPAIGDFALDPPQAFRKPCVQGDERSGNGFQKPVCRKLPISG